MELVQSTDKTERCNNCLSKGKSVDVKIILSNNVVVLCENCKEKLAKRLIEYPKK